VCARSAVHETVKTGSEADGGTAVCSEPVSSQADGGALYFPVNLADESVGASPREGTNEDERLYPPVNSSASGEQSVAWENRRTLSDGSRLVAALTPAAGGREPLYLNPQPGPDPLAEVRRMVESMAGDADPPHLNPG
jgi:hypothetical protein